MYETAHGPLVRPTTTIPLKARLFRALSDEPRLAVLEQLTGGEQRVTDLAEILRLSPSSVSTHLASLHAAGAVERHADGRRVSYALAHPKVGALLQDAEEIVLAAVEQAYTCAQPCCQPGSGEHPGVGATL